MTHAKSLGIFMDHSSAHLIEFKADADGADVIDSESAHQGKEESSSGSENVMHNKEQQQQAEYYRKLGEVIKKYDAVLLFGPTNAKSELHNILKADHLFEGIKIEVKAADKLTENQQQAFVREHFSDH